MSNEGEYVVAEELGREAISVLPNEACIIFNFAILLAKMQKYADAEYYFSRTIKLKPGIPIHHINFGKFIFDNKYATVLVCVCKLN